MRQNNKSVFAKRNVSLRITQPVKILKLCFFLKNAIKTFHFTFVTFDSMVFYMFNKENGQGSPPSHNFSFDSDNVWLDTMFSGAVFTAHFQKIAQIAILCDFHYISKGISSLMHFWLQTTSVLRIWFLLIFARPTKMHEPRTVCTVNYTLSA